MNWTDDIDQEIRQLVIDLNEAGLCTFSSCQGKRSVEDYRQGRHCDHAFISFDEIPRKLKRRAKKCGLEIYNGGISICPLYPDDNPETMMKHNLEFVKNMKRLFFNQSEAMM